MDASSTAYTGIFSDPQIAGLIQKGNTINSQDYKGYRDNNRRFGNFSPGVALRGYALFFRDSTARMITPHPTSLLFVPSSPTPGPSPTPAPTPDASRFSVIIIPDTLDLELPCSVRSARAFQDFEAGKGEAALLTAEQAKRLPFPVSACPLPKGKGGLPIRGSAATTGGEAFLAFLCAEPSQKALADNGLFSPYYSIYHSTDPLREMIENSL